MIVHSSRSSTSTLSFLRLDEGDNGGSGIGTDGASMMEREEYGCSYDCKTEI